MNADDPPSCGVPIRIVQRVYADAAAIWPDGDTPAHPTVADVIKVIKRYADKPLDILSDWDAVEATPMASGCAG